MVPHRASSPTKMRTGITGECKVGEQGLCGVCLYEGSSVDPVRR